MKALILIILVFIFFSCKSSFNSKLIINCSNSKVNDSDFYRIDNNTIDFYFSLLDAEQTMISNNLIKNTSKIAYKEGISKIDANEINLEELKHIKEEIDLTFLKNHFRYQSGSINNLIFNCFDLGFKNNLENYKDSSLYLQKDRAEYLFANTGLYYDKENLYSLIDIVGETDFKNIIFRSSLILFIYENIEHKLDGNQQKNFRNQNK
jgi:hypothetical protein